MRALLCAAVLAATSSLPDAGDAARLELPPDLARLLDTGKWDATPFAFRAIALSHIADGCAAQGLAHPARHAAAVACADKAVARARALLPSPDPEDVKDALLLTHVNLTLGARDRLGGCADPRLHAALSKRLAAMSLADQYAIAPSYGAFPDRWPADQSATLASLGRHDAAHGSALLPRPLAAFRAVMTTKAAQPGGLPRSELARARRSSKHPRGCANSFIARYLAEVDPPLAATWWAAYRKAWLVPIAGLRGFREWPPGVDGPADADSGPILLGVGMAASALGIAAARAQGDEALAAQLELSADTVSQFAGPLAQLLFAQAIRFEGRWQPRLLPATPSPSP